MLDPGREVRRRQEQGRRHPRRDRAGLVASRRSSSWAPTPSSSSPSSSPTELGIGRAPVRLHRAHLRGMQEVRHPHAAGADRLPDRTARRRKTRRTSTARPRRSSRVPASSAASATSTRPSSPAPSATRPTSSSCDNLHALSEASAEPWVLLSAGVDYPSTYKQVKMAMETGCSGVLGGRAFWKEYFLQDGAEARTKFAATEGPPSASPRSTRSSRSTAPPGSPGTA